MPRCAVKLPPTGVVHIWKLPLSGSDSLHRHCLSLLSAQELERASRYCFSIHREEFTTCRGLVKWILGQYLETDPKALQWEIGSGGKPRLSAPLMRALEFNVSHSNGLALLAVTRECSVGVDLEFKRNDLDFMALAARFFSRSETERLLRLEGTARKEAFYACWTRKEAFVKAIGEGLSFPLDALDVSIEEGAQQALLELRHSAHRKEDWHLLDLSQHLDNDYAAALAVGTDGLALRPLITMFV